jgi:hypothetical protein
MRGMSKFKASEITRILKAITAAGTPADVEIDKDGTYRIIPKVSGSPAADPPSDDGNPWDEVLTNDPHKKRPA